MRKFLISLFMTLFLVMNLVGCGTDNKVKIYNNPDTVEVSHVEKAFTGVVSKIDLENNKVDFVACMDGTEYSLAFHGGVSITDANGTNLLIDSVSCGMVMDVTYYEDTGRLVSMVENSNVTKLKGISKFVYNQEQNKATYKGTSVSASEYLTAYDGENKIDPLEISTEDEVTLYIYGSRLVSVSVEIGHGYVRLKNHDTYIGGMVEIGYDVIVPVTEDMLIAVREGDYTLRIDNGDGYNTTKEVSVYKDKETEVDLYAQAVPKGTATINVTPTDAKIFVNGKEISGYAYTDYYGTYRLKITADGYNTFNGQFSIKEPLKVFDVSLKEDPNSTETTEESSTEEESTTENATEEGNVTESSTEVESTTESTTENAGTTEQATQNYIHINGPAGVGVYLDGDYVGIAPVSFPKKEGTHSIVLYSQGFLIKSYSITAVNDGTDDEYTFDALASLEDLIE